MTDPGAQQTAEQTFWKTVNEAARAAPQFKFSINWFYLLCILAAIGATFAPVFVPVPFDWAAIYIAPIVLFFAIVANHNRVIRRTGDQYKRCIRPQLAQNYGQSGVDIDRLATVLWGRKQQTPPFLLGLFLTVFIVSVGLHFWHAFGDVVLSQLTTWMAWLSFFGRILLFLLGVVLSFFFSLTVALAVNANTKFTFDELRRATFGPQSDMEPVERNMLSIVSHGVRLASMFRRVENYTLESTLIGALAFSAFVTVLVESEVRIGDLGWLRDVRVQWQEMTLWDRSFSMPLLPNLFELASANIESTIAAFLLTSAVCFLAVLVARIQFTDAYRHADDLQAQAKWLNEKEDQLLKEHNDRASHFSRQGAQILNELDDAAKKLAPIMDFMATFRNWGLWIFLGAIAICGLHYSIYFMGLILFIFAASTLFFILYRMTTLDRLAEKITARDWNLGALSMPRRAPEARETRPS